MESNSSSEDITVARAILDILSLAGVETIFGLPGVHNLAFWKEESVDTPRILGVRHEQTTVYAADGLARASGGLGVALTTTGPGAANAVGAFGEAAASGSPVLLISSEVSTQLKRPGIIRGVLHESLDQSAIFSSLAKAVFCPRTAEDAVSAILESIEVALEWPRGPVYVDIPTDVLLHLVDKERVIATNPPERVAPIDLSITSAIELLNSVEKIVIWVGGGVVQSGEGAEKSLLQLCELLRAPVVTTFSARGVIPPTHPCAVNLPPHEPEVARLIGEADLMLAVGSDFDGMMTRNWTMPRPRHLISINCDSTDLSKNFVPDVEILADAELAMRALLEYLSGDGSDLPSLDAMRTDVWNRLRTDPRSESACFFLDAVDFAVGKNNAVVIADMAIPGYWFGGYGRIQRSRQLQYPVGWGTLGYAVPASVGAGARMTDPVLVVCGDGGFMFAIGELAVIAHEQLPVTILLVDDGGYGMLRYDQDHAGDKRNGVELFAPDFVKLGESFGIETVKLGNSDPRLGVVLDEALSSRAPRIIILEQILAPPRTTSPRWNE